MSAQVSLAAQLQKPEIEAVDKRLLESAHGSRLTLGGWTESATHSWLECRVGGLTQAKLEKRADPRPWQEVWDGEKGGHKQLRFEIEAFTSRAVSPPHRTA